MQPAEQIGSRPGRRVRDRIVAVMLWGVAALIVCVLGRMLWDIARGGWSHLTPTFLSAQPEDAGREGGIGPMIVSTLLLLAVTLAVAAPIALATAVGLAEHTRGPSMFARVVRRSLDALAAVPSIVFGLFGNAFFCNTLGMGYSILAGGCTLACMALPIMILTTEQAIRAVPDELRQGAAALGMSRTTTLMRVELPVAAPALGAGLVLGIGRALAETAALLFTAGYVTRTPESLFDSGRALSVHVFDMAMNVPGGGGRAYATAWVLVALLLIVNAAAIGLTRLAAGQTESYGTSEGADA